MNQYHYVIYFDEETKEWIHDCDTESIYFDNKTIWNTETEEWESAYLGDGLFNKTQEDVDELFADGIEFLNRISPVKHLTKKEE